MTEGSSRSTTRRNLLLCAGFLLGVLAVDQGLGWALDSMVDDAKSGLAIGLVNRALDHRDSEIIVFGHSRARHHVVPRVLTDVTGCSAYNAGLNGQGVYYHRMLASVMLTRGTSARMFVLVAEPSSLLFGHAERAANMKPFIDEDPNVQRLIREITPFASIKLQSRTFRYNGLLLPILRSRLFPADATSDGYVPMKGSLGAEEVQGVELVGSEDAPVQEDLVRVTREFILSAKDHGVRVVLVQGPRLSRARGEAAAAAALAALADETDTPLIVIDEQTHPEFLEPRWYRNPAHLGPAGAERFTRLVATEIRDSGLLDGACSAAGGAATVATRP